MRLNLRRLGLLAGKAARMFAGRAKLTPQRIDVMLLIRQARYSQTDLAHRLCVTPCVVSRMLKALVGLGLVVQETCGSDGRIRIARLTEEGVERLARCFPAPTRIGAQDHGERTWLRRWRTSIRNLGIRVDGLLRSRAPSPGLCYVFALKNECWPDLVIRNESVEEIMALAQLCK